MKTLTLPAVLLSGLTLSLLATVLAAVLSGPLYFNEAISITIAVITAFYIGVLLKFSQLKTGRLLLLATYICAAVLLIISGISAQWFALFSLSAIWLCTLVYYRFGLFAAVYHAILLTVGVFTASWVIVATGSWFLCFWCFFLMQSPLFFAHQPAKPILTRDSLATPEDSNAVFENAYKCADKSVQQLLKI
ncbi:MAG: hypothetical protein GY951_02010 [Psychromonas sp.]|nr:hypothetical protein [Alteromonadales bacterium]MCP5076820.1 hypothetical protein [Psychromonas sp.]